MTHILGEIYTAGVVHDRNGVEHRLHSNVNPLEGQFLEDLVAADPAIKRTLEIGCAYGLSSLHLLQALADRADAHHTIVDPFQFDQWHGVGIENIERAGFSNYTLAEERSEVLLPALAAAEPASLDLVFIDGFHTFDHTLVDLFFANRLLRVGGYIVVDDCNFSAVAKAVSYVEQYPAYEIHSQSPSEASLKRRAADIASTALPPRIATKVLPQAFYDRIYIRTRYSTMVALQKIADDDRPWDWFIPF